MDVSRGIICLVVYVAHVCVVHAYVQRFIWQLHCGNTKALLFTPFVLGTLVLLPTWSAALLYCKYGPGVFGLGKKSHKNR